MDVRSAVLLKVFKTRNVAFGRDGQAPRGTVPWAALKFISSV